MSSTERSVPWVAVSSLTRHGRAEFAFRHEQKFDCVTNGVVIGIIHASLRPYSTLNTLVNILETKSCIVHL